MGSGAAGPPGSSRAPAHDARRMRLPVSPPPPKAPSRSHTTQRQRGACNIFRNCVPELPPRTKQRRGWPRLRPFDIRFDERTESPRSRSRL